MKTISSVQNNNEARRPIYFEVGLIISLVIVLLGFEFRSYKADDTDLQQLYTSNDMEEMGEITIQKPPEIPPPRSNVQSTIIEIVENETEVTTDIEVDVEANQETVVQEWIPPAIIEQEDEEEEEEPVFVVVESMPEFPGGEVARLQYLSENLQYPTLAREAGISGAVYVSFVVEKDGQISNIRILRGIGGGCDEEALRVVSEMPKWIPGRQRNIPVRVQFNMPIRFILL